MTTNSESNSKTVQAWNGRVGPAILCPFRFLFAVYQAVSSSQGGGGVAALITQRLKKQFIGDRFARLGQNGMGRQFETGRTERMGPEVFSCWAGFPEAGSPA